MTVPTAEAELELREAIVNTGVLVERDIEQFFASLNRTRPELARDELLRFSPILVAQYGDIVSSFAADAYDELRFQEGVRGAFAAETVVSSYATAVEPTVRRVAGELFEDNWDAALAALVDKMPKYALAAGRETIIANTGRDLEAVGWYRIASPNACAFCRALAARGAVYKELTVNFAAHGHCRCTSMPSWDPTAPEVPVDAYVASARTTNMGAASKARHRQRTREWVASID